MTKWRQRVSEEQLLELLAETIATAQREGHTTQQDLVRVNVDTTVQEKNTTHPTDSKLYHRATVKLGEVAKQRGVKRRQTYVRVAKHAAIKVGR